MTATRFVRARNALAAGLAAALLAAGCAASTATYPIRQRARLYDETALDRDYREEHDYIQQRRNAVATPDVFVKEFWPECYEPATGSDAAARCAALWRVLRERAEAGVRPGNLVGLAFSGGGIRSANFSLGVLQGLDGQRVLPQVDYLSAVSGGAYMAGWVQAHLGGDQHDFYYDDVHYKIAANNFHDLLDRTGDNVEHLRTHAGFLNQGGWFEGTKAAWSWVWRWPFNLVIDVIVHVKGRINTFHPIAIYYNRLEETYFRGEPPKVGNAPPAKHKLALREVNANLTTPYTVINGNLVNRGGSRQAPEDDRERFNFEFTRDLSGSDGLGYVDSRAFDRPVLTVTETGGVPTAVTIKDTGPFRLSHAVAASGAAFDPEGYFQSIDYDWLRAGLDYVAAPLNLNLGYETWNFARGLDGPFGTTVDYARMLTYQRVTDPRTDARWIKITDGGHYENLGVMSLVRRGVSCVIAVDADADPKFKFGDLRTLQTRLRELGLTLELPADKLAEARAAGRTTLVVTRGEQVVSTILYLKPNANGRDPVSHAPITDVVAPHMDETDKDEDSADAIRKISWYRRTRRASDFPHTSTLRQWYDWETFDAYRLLGFQMAKTYLPYDADLRECRFAR